MPTRRSPARAAPPVLVASALALAACGSGEKGTAVPAHPDVVVAAVGGLKFDKATYTASSGDVAIEYDNDDIQTHTMIIENASGKKVSGWTRLALGPRDKKGGTVKLAAGTYKIICDIHEGAGMVATLTVS